MKERTVAGLHTALLGQLPPSLSPNDPILDLGCGTGAWLERLAAAGFTNLSGVDRDVHHWEAARARHYAADLEASTWPEIAGGPFKLVTAIEVIEHLGSPGAFLGRIAHLLAPQGSAIVTTPNLHSLIARLRLLLKNRLKSFDVKGDPTHVSPMFEEPLRRLCARAGLRITDIRCYPASGSLTARWPLRVLARGMGFVLRDKLPGDVACFRLTRAS